MKIIIAQSTVNALTIAGAEVINTIGEPLGKSEKPLAVADLLPPCDEYVNHSVKLEGDNVVLELNDELFFKYMSVYLKVAKFVAPFIKPAMALMHALQSDVRDIEEWMKSRK